MEQQNAQLLATGAVALAGLCVHVVYLLTCLCSVHLNPSTRLWLCVHQCVTFVHPGEPHTPILHTAYNLAACMPLPLLLLLLLHPAGCIPRLRSMHALRLPIPAVYPSLVLHPSFYVPCFKAASRSSRLHFGDYVYF